MPVPPPPLPCLSPSSPPPSSSSSQEIIERLVKLNPSYRPPSDYVRQKPSRKLYIPVKEYPTYNFIGLIIGQSGSQAIIQRPATKDRSVWL